MLGERMTEPTQTEPQIADTEADEVVDGLPVLATTREISTPPEPLLPRQAAMVAATGFAAGAATVALAHRRQVRKSLGRGRRRKSKGVIGEVLGSNSFLVDVHLLRRD